MRVLVVVLLVGIAGCGGGVITCSLVSLLRCTSPASVILVSNRLTPTTSPCSFRLILAPNSNNAVSAVSASAV